MQATDPLIIHYAHDMQRAIAFYSGVFDTQPAFASPGWTTYDFGTFELALHILMQAHHDERPLPNAGLNLLVPNIEVFQARIEAHGGSLRDLREPDDFVPVRVAAFFDSERNGFELRQAV